MLRVEAVDAGYGSVQVLWDISLEVNAGELVAVVGANGAGKTTLLRIITGLLPQWRGRVVFDDRRIGGRSAHEIVNLGIAHVPEGRQLFPEMTVEEHLLVGSSLLRARAHRRTNFERVYATFPQLKERRHQDAGTLSGGEQQMLAIARALMSAPRLLILDEPSLGLAPMLVRQVLHDVAAIRRQGVTVLLVEQNVQQALGLTDRAYVLQNGRVVLSGSGTQLLQRDEVRRAYMGI